MGILQDNMQPAAAAPMAPPAAAGQPAQGGQPQQGAKLPPPNPEIMSPIVQAHIPELEQMRNLLDGKMGDAYDRVLTAGMKMLYSPETADVIFGIVFDDKIPMANKLGEGIANLLVMMDNQGNGTIPKEVLAPVGVALMFEAADYMFESGIPVSEEDLSKALELMINGIFIGYGIDPAKMDELVDDMGEKLGFADTEQGKEVNGMKGTESPTTDKDQAEGPAEPDEDAAFNEGFAKEQTTRTQV